VDYNDKLKLRLFMDVNTFKDHAREATDYVLDEVIQILQDGAKANEWPQLVSED
jgi:hypothetical protein